MIGAPPRARLDCWFSMDTTVRHFFGRAHGTPRPVGTTWRSWRGRCRVGPRVARVSPSLPSPKHITYAGPGRAVDACRPCRATASHFMGDGAVLLDVQGCKRVATHGHRAHVLVAAQVLEAGAAAHKVDFRLRHLPGLQICRCRRQRALSALQPRPRASCRGGPDRGCSLRPTTSS